MFSIAGETNKRRPASFALASSVAEKLLSFESDRIQFVYNRFISAISFKLEEQFIHSFKVSKESGNSRFNSWNFDGNKDELLKDLHEFRIGATLYSLNIESSTAEQSSRMNAMDNSSKNASEMLSILSMKYNKARQTKITTELIEIISGASAME